MLHRDSNSLNHLAVYGDSFDTNTMTLVWVLFDGSIAVAWLTEKVSSNGEVTFESLEFKGMYSFAWDTSQTYEARPHISLGFATASKLNIYAIRPSAFTG